MAVERSIGADIQHQTCHLDLALAEWASSRPPVVARWQLFELGFGAGAIRHRLAVGRLHRLYPGVYAIGHTTVGASGRLMAAVLACGRGAALSHRSAAEHWDLVRSSRAVIDVTAARGCRAKRGVVVHHTVRLDRRDLTVRDGIPVTSLARTLLDFAAVARPAELVRALEQAQRLRLFDGRALDELLGRSRGRRGAAALRAALAELGDEAPDLKSPLEDRFRAFCRERGLPEPAWNVMVAGFWVDAAWPSHGVVVELDSRKHHAGIEAFESDRKRDTKLQIAGFQVVRVTDRRLKREADELYADLCSLLAQW